MTALRWLCYSGRPLTAAEMVDVLAIENGEGGGFFPAKRLPEPADIMEVCLSLVSCNAVDNDDDGNDDEDSNVDVGDRSGRVSQADQIRLAHFSVEEYLLSDQCAFRSDFATQTCHQQIAESCLMRFEWQTSPSPRFGEVCGCIKIDQHFAFDIFQIFPRPCVLQSYRSGRFDVLQT